MEAVVLFNRLIGDVDNLLMRHESADGKVSFPTKNERPLLRSCMLLMYAAWEVYVEESLVELVEWLATRPAAELPQATKDFITSKNKIDPWQLVDGGWRQVLPEVVGTYVRGLDDHPSSFGLSNANPKGVAELHYSVLGESVLDSVSWHNSTNSTIRTKLMRFVTIRGEIAHTGRTRARLWAQDVKKWREFIPKLVQEMDYHFRVWMTIRADADSEWWREVHGHLSEHESATGIELQALVGIVRPLNNADRPLYESFLAFMGRRVAAGVLEKSGNGNRPVFRLPASDEPSLSI
ncbi:MAG: hypothetical protein KIT89_11110 [Microcella sp.]|uniref:HEPN domain-containing protein n=1 Tax=Microcella sp. TaxID=1913979 RepID=UPI0024C55F9F|nr:HEPN domain-containing protein [Microcella sp.]UYN83236.1 MAG: hypothetical protein KIT89_11110 [Microcella sp.]